MDIFNKTIINEGDCVILRLSHDNLIPKIMEANKIDHIAYGSVKHNEIIGKPYGSKVTINKGFFHVLPMTPEIWNISLPHRTQIIYSHDASLIIGQLDLRPGCFVAEAGTGSGAMTHYLARSVLPNGHVYTFEFHEERAQKAFTEFQEHGMSHIVTSSHRDVIGEGFPEGLQVDAIMLDLPNPASMVMKIIKILKRCGRICFFSPCIEQVQKTVDSMKQLKRFSEIETMTMLQRQYNNVRNPSEEPNIGQDFEDGRENCGAIDNANCHTVHRTKFVIPKETDDQRYDAVPQSNTAGHSGYLTFATFI